MQRQFCSVFPIEPEGQLPRFDKKSDVTVEDLIITEEMVKKEIKDLDSSKAFGPDEIHPKFLKELVNFIVTPLTIIMNKLLQTGTLPKDWKMAHVSPLYKKGSKNIAANYRPVSLTSIVCKMMESIITKSLLVPHLKNLFSEKQYGFISKRSTSTQLLHFLDKCRDVMADGNVVDCIYFDFAKAFDAVPHRRLI